MMDTDFGVKAEPPPVQGEQSKSVTDGVISDLLKRRESGKKKYGTELMSHNGRDPLVDAYQEALDLVCYLRQAIMERRQT